MNVNYYKKRLIPLPFTDRNYEIDSGEALQDLKRNEGERLSVQTPDSEVRLPLRTQEDYQEVQAFHDPSVDGPELAQALKKLSQGGATFHGKTGPEEESKKIGGYGAYNGLTGELGITDVKVKVGRETISVDHPGMLLAWAGLENPQPLNFSNARVDFDRGQTSMHPFEATLGILSGRPSTVEVTPPDSNIKFRVSKPEDLYELEAFYATSTHGAVAEPELVEKLQKLDQMGGRFLGKYGGRPHRVGRFGAYNALTGEHGITGLGIKLEGQQIPLEDRRMLDFLLEGHTGLESRVTYLDGQSKPIHAYEAALKLQHGEEVKFRPPHAKTEYALDQVELVESLYGKKTGDVLTEELKKFEKHSKAFKSGSEEVDSYRAYLDLSMGKSFQAKRIGELEIDSLGTLQAVNQFYDDKEHPIHLLGREKLEIFDQKGEPVHPFEASKLKSYSYGAQGKVWRAAEENPLEEAKAFQALFNNEMAQDLTSTQYAFEHREQNFDLNQALNLVKAGPEGSDARKLTAFALKRSRHYLAPVLLKDCGNQKVELDQIHSYMNGSKTPEQSLSELESKMSFAEFREAALGYLKERPELKTLLEEKLPGDSGIQRVILRNLLANQDVKTALTLCLEEWQKDYRHLKAGMPLVLRFLDQSPPDSAIAFARSVAFNKSDLRLKKTASTVGILKAGLAAPEKESHSKLLQTFLKEVEDQNDRYQVAEAVVPLFKEEFPQYADRFELGEELLKQMTGSAPRGVTRLHLLDSLARSQAEFGLGLVDKLIEVSGRDATRVASGILEAVHPERAEWLKDTFHNSNGWFLKDWKHVAILHREMLESEDVWETIGKASERILDGKSDSRSGDQRTLFKHALSALELESDTFKANQMTRETVWRGNDLRLKKTASIQALLGAFVRHREAKNGIGFLQFARDALSGVEDSVDAGTVADSFLDKLLWMPDTGSWANLTRYLAQRLSSGPKAQLLKTCFAQPLPRKKEDFYGLLGTLVESVEDPASRFAVAEKALKFLEINAEGEPKEQAQRTLNIMKDREMSQKDRTFEAMATLAVLSEQFAPEKVTGDIKMGDEYIEFGDILVPIND